MRQLGVPQDQITRALVQPVPKEDVLTVAPHLVDVAVLFSSLRSQWRTVGVGMGGIVFTGLDYTALQPTMHMLELEPTDRTRLFENLRTMEMEALRAMNERK